MRVNVKPKFEERTHEGAVAARMTDEQALRRSVLSCLLFEDEFYEDGESISARITRLALARPAGEIAALAIEARETMHLRHVPLLLLSVLAKTGSGHSLVSETIARVIQRADEIPEFLAIHAKREGVKANAKPSELKRHISAQMKKGIAKAFGKFDEYQLAKYDRAGEIRLRDAMFLTHPKSGPAVGMERAGLYQRLASQTLVTPDTWEVQLSGGADKKDTFERLIREGKLGYLALLRNLRNMIEAGCDEELVRGAILARKGGAHRVLPFRYVAAARAAPRVERDLDTSLIASLEASPKLTGKTVVLVDVSSSMGVKLSGRSDMTRMDAAAALASMIQSDSLVVYSFSDHLAEVPARMGMAGVDAIQNSQDHGGTRLIEAVAAAIDREKTFDRIIVISDEQAFAAMSGYPTALPQTLVRAYMINVASAKNGIAYSNWTHIDGWSESVLKFIAASEGFSVALGAADGGGEVEA